MILKEEHIRALLRYIGENPDREGLENTPARVMRAWTEMTAGYNMHPGQILATTFAETSDEMVIVRDIEFHSNCEHHMLPFSGTADVGYIPGVRVVGLSKIPRLVECFAKRLQVQERLTNQIAQAMNEYLDPMGVAVVLNARHSCMGCRGVRQSRASMTTSAMLGRMREDRAARAEFLALIR